jgi:hypothetical protein
MAAVLQIGIDPTAWSFDPARYDAVAAGLAQPGVPFVVDVFSPIEGRLVLNPLAAGSVALTKPLGSPHWNPNGVVLAKSLAVYVASATGPHKGLPGYALAPGSGYDLPALEQEIIGAMTGKTVLTMKVETSTGDSGVLVLSGATLSYAVLCPPKPGVS